MFKFFTQKEWRLWSWIGSFIILFSLWVQVQIDVKINEWFGQFYDMIQKALGAPNSITIEEYWASLLSFITLAGIYVALATVVAFFTSHYLFRWRTAMIDWYHSVYDKARTIEGASQRVQEDTIKFSRIMEGLGTSFIEAIMMLIEFTPILFSLSIGILLVIAEDDITIRPKNLDELFDDVRKIHFKSYLRYFYFNLGRITYLQANVLSAYVFLAPAIVAGVVTLGVMQQIIRAFGRVEGSMQYIFRSWPTIIELASVYKRLKEFESKINATESIIQKH